MDNAHKIQTTYAAAYSLAHASTKPQPENYTSRGLSVSNFAYKSDQNAAFRPQMEDACVMIDSYLGDPNQGFFALFDGHGGSQAVDFCKARLHDELRISLQEAPEDVPRAMTRCFQRIDEKMRAARTGTSGTTATVALLRKERYQKVLYTANVGDSKGVLVSASGVEQLTAEHKCSDLSELQRISAGDGIIMRGRVAGQLAVTRALGDFHLKTCGVTNVPFVSRKVITHDDVCLVIASDGLWDTVDYTRLRANRAKTSLAFANELMQMALSSGSQDNIAIEVICF
jgi:serine/threonine protein phosphatase PrpC